MSGRGTIAAGLEVGHCRERPGYKTVMRVLAFLSFVRLHDPRPSALCYLGILTLRFYSCTSDTVFCVYQFIYASSLVSQQVDESEERLSPRTR